MFRTKCQSIIRHLWKIHLAYAVAAFTLVITHTFSWSQTVTFAQFLFLASAIIILTKAVQDNRKTINQLVAIANQQNREINALKQALRDTRPPDP